MDNAKNSGITTEWVDNAVKPGDDFFRHVNGRWLDTYEIPADRSKDGGLYTLRDDAEKHVREIVERIAKEQPESRIGALYNSFMDTEKIESDGLEPLMREVAPILNAATSEQLAVTLALLSRAGLAQLLGWYTSIDQKDPRALRLLHHPGRVGPARRGILPRREVRTGMRRVYRAYRHYVRADRPCRELHPDPYGGGTAYFLARDRDRRASLGCREKP